MTWLSYSTTVLSLFVVLPKVLHDFSPDVIVLWYLFFTIISFQGILDFGFRQTFSRIISYAFKGAIGIDNEIRNIEVLDSDSPNELLLSKIISTMKYIYIRLTIIVFIFMGIIGSYLLNEPIKNTTDVNTSWLCWIIILIVSCISFYGKVYLNYLEGINEIVLVRRFDILTSLGLIFTNIAVLYLSPTLICLVLSNQAWVLIVTFRDWYLCRTINCQFYLKIEKNKPFDKDILRQIWNPAWRSGISGFMSVGLTNLTSLYYAQIGNTMEVASYLLAMRFINQIKDVSMAPFYSKIPSFAMLRIANNYTELIKIVKKGMFLSHFVFVIGFILVGFFSSLILEFVHSQVPFVSLAFWALLGLSFFLHRFGAMHMQVHMSTNNIISHKVDGITGILVILYTCILKKFIGIYAIPVGMLMAYLSFYSWYSAFHSYRSLNVKFWVFEKTTSLFSLMLILAFSIYFIFKN